MRNSFYCNGLKADEVSASLKMLIFDTLKFVDRLKDAGIPEGHAKAEAMALMEALTEAFQNRVASKEDIHRLEREIIALDQRMERRLNSLDQKIDKGLASLDQKIDKGLTNLDQKIDNGLASLDQKIDNGLTSLDHKLGAEMAGLDRKFAQRFAAIEQRLAVNTWILGVLVTGVVSLVLKAFF